MATFFFLEAARPLVKTYTLGENNAIETSSYPMTKRFKSHPVEITDLKDLYKALNQHAALGHCLIKGTLHRDLEWEHRRKATKSTDKTEWICLDLDSAPFDNVEALMGTHPILKDTSYIVQYSGSQGIGKPGLNAHIFILLDRPYNAAFLKSWLMQMNLDGSLFAGTVRKSLSMNVAGTTLHWPIDITACQNDKLIYIAQPVIGKGVRYNPPNPVIQLVTKKRPYLAVDRIKIDKIEKWKDEARTVLNPMRKAAGLSNLTKPRLVKGVEVQCNPGELTISSLREDEEFVRINFNGGDSWAYWHPRNNFELIHSFKGEPSMYTKEVAPQYYQECVARQQQEATLPTEDGEIILGVCDKRSALLWKISWNPEAHELKRYPAKSDRQLMDWLLQHGRVPGDFTPQWTFEFNPTNPTVIDLERQYLNTYVASQYYRLPQPKATASIDKCPTIKKVIMSVCSGNEWNDVTEHFMNWLAVVFQHRIKIGTTWLFSGTEGTGKNLLSNHILRPLIGNHYVKEVLIGGLEDQFNAWLEYSLLCFVNEIQVSSSKHREIIAGKLRNWITDSPLDIRPMGTTRYDADNFCNFIMNSNKRDAVMIDNSDRRYNIGIFQETKLHMTEHEVTKLIPKELPFFFHYLMTRTADIEKARKIMDNDARKNMILENKTSLGMLCDALLAGDIEPFVEALPDTQHVVASGGDSVLALAYHKTISRELQGLLDAKPDKSGNATFVSKLSRDELVTIFTRCIGKGIPDSPNKFTRMLQYHNIHTKRIRLADGNTTYGIAVIWTATKDWCDEYRPTKQQGALARTEGRNLKRVV